MAVICVGAAGLSGFLYALSFPPLSFSLLMWLALVPLLLVISASAPRSAFVYGLVWGLAMTAGVAWCLPGMLATYFSLPWPLGWLGGIGVGIGFAGVYVAAYAAWVAWLVRRGRASPLLLAAGWVVCEFARATLLVGNPWALSAYSQMRATVLVQIADATGPYGLGFLIAAVNACVAAVVSPALRGTRPLRSVVAVLMAVAAALVYGEWRLGQTFADGDAVEIAVVQGGMPPSAPGHLEQRRIRLQRYLELTEKAALQQPTLIVWPEYAVESYLQEETAARDDVLQIAGASGADLILGGPHYARTNGRTHYHNSVFLIRGGRLDTRYDKAKLVPFAEGNELAWLRPSRRVSYEAGHTIRPLPAAAGLRLGAFLCFESMYPELVRRFANRDATALVNLSNDSWFGHAAPAAHQLDITALRAVENRRYLIRAAATGFSAIIDPYGRMIAHSGFGTAEVLTARIAPSAAQTPYQRWGDAFAWLNVAVVLSVSIAFRRRSESINIR